MNKNQTDKIRNDKITKEQFINLIDSLIEEVLVQNDTIAQMQLKIDHLEDELDYYRTDSLLGL